MSVVLVLLYPAFAYLAMCDSCCSLLLPEALHTLLRRSHGRGRYWIPELVSTGDDEVSRVGGTSGSLSASYRAEYQSLRRVFSKVAPRNTYFNFKV